LLTLVRELAVPPTARAEINIFPLKKSDAAAVATMLQQLFLGTGGIGSGRTTTGPAAPTGPGTTGQTNRTLTFTLQGQPVEGVPLIPVTVTIDERTNSIIAAGSRNDLLVIQAIITKLETAEVPERRNEVYALHNASAIDVATALTTFLTNAIAINKSGPTFTPYQDFQQEVVVVAEPVTNKLLISASPRYYGDLVRLIQELDAESPQVVIQVLVAEVDLTGSEEFGVEIGLQTPVLFQRGIYPAPGLAGAGTVNFANATGGVITPGVTVNSTINPTGLPGFNFNQPSLPLGNNVAVAPSLIGYQGLNSLGVGRVSPTSGIGGFVFSAASDTFNLLIRALKTQGRIDILSRPQVMTLDNQQARVLVGQSVPYISGSNVTATGLVTNTILYRDVGVQLQVTPKITPDNRVLMRVVPEISSVATTQVQVGNGTTATAFNVQTVETTVLAGDGETVAIGGLIAKKDTKNENKIPWLGDLPVFGAGFRYRSQEKVKTELLVILTPRVVRCKAEADRILAEESRRMDWIFSDVLRYQGTTGMEHLLPRPENVDGAVAPQVAPPTVPQPMLPVLPQPQQPQQPQQPMQPMQPPQSGTNEQPRVPVTRLQGPPAAVYSSPTQAQPAYRQ
jgi:type II secretory pathway component GspD/PulD (secretin)